jgi:uncharacterized protein (TIGR03067 family)
VKSYRDRGEHETADRLLVLTGQEFTASDGNTTVMKGSFTIDPAKKSKIIDLESTSGRHQGETLEGVYELDGDKLKICFVAPGGKRPKALVSTLDNNGFRDGTGTRATSLKHEPDGIRSRGHASHED